jgi:glyoxylase-like metal-dependent hydrolase (beta-lactamase superfamily II)
MTTDGWSGGTITERATCVLAPNPGPMTLDGTNTWVLVEPDSHEAVVVDPGPDVEAHLDAVVHTAAARDAAVRLILLTHRHLDHSESARRFAERVGAPVRALDPAMRLGEEGLGDGDVVDVGGLEVRVVATPGHTSDSLSFLLSADRAVLTGDTVLGRGTTVVAHPDGRLADYLESLDRLATLARNGSVATVLPGHGPVLADAYGAISYYQRHRAERLAQVEQALAAGARTPYEVVEIVYADVDRALWPAAELSVRAQLEYLGRRS